MELQIEILLFANLMFAALSLIYVNDHEIVMLCLTKEQNARTDEHPDQTKRHSLPTSPFSAVRRNAHGPTGALGTLVRKKVH